MFLYANTYLFNYNIKAFLFFYEKEQKVGVMPNSCISYITTTILCAMSLHSNSFFCAIHFFDFNLSPNFVFIIINVVSPFFSLPLVHPIPLKIHNATHRTQTTRPPPAPPVRQLRHSIPLPLRNSALRTPLFRYAKCYGCSRLRIRNTAKSIAVRKLQSPKKFARWAAMCYAGLVHKAPAPQFATAPQLRSTHSAKSIAPCKLHL